jgi:hypothetical protein
LPTNAATSALQTQPGVDIGDVTVNNSTGAAAVNIQDGGNSITIDGTVTAVQATGTNLHAVIDSGSTTAVTGNVTVVQPTGTNLHVVVDTAPTTAVTQNTSPWVDNITQFGSTNLSTGVGASGAGIPRVTVANDSSIKITDGTDTLLVNTDGSISAVPVPIGTHANAWNAATVSSGGNSTAIDCQFVRTISIFGNSSGNLNPMRIQASQDNTNWYTLTTFSISTGNFGTTIDFGARYLRLQSGQGANLTLTATITRK